MQITADVSKISKTAQRNINFILNVLSEFSINFAQFSIVQLKGMLLVSHKVIFIENEAVTMRNYAGMCKDICSFNLDCNFLIQLLPLQNSVSVMHFSNAFGMETRHLQKVVLKMKLFLSLQSFICHYVFTCVAIKIKNFHSCIRVVRVALVSLVSHSCLALVL